MFKHRLATLLALILLVGLLPVGAATAHDDDGDRYYLSLGDSVAAGMQQPLLFTDNGYTDVLFRRVRGEMDLTEHVNLACPGDDTAEMIDDVAVELATSDAGSLCYGNAAPQPPGGAHSQLDAALAFLAAHPGEVGLITITIGANDILACDLNDPPPVLNACLVTQMGQVGINLPVILTELRGAAPGVPIVGMNYYNPNLALWFTPVVGPTLAEDSNTLTATFNGLLETLYGLFGVPVADVAGAFGTFNDKPGDPPRNVKLACKFTLMCERVDGELTLRAHPDIHPSN
ncbi:MAG: SGNH/GDSL hydrolase family protein, partial [Acidimicrobiia bacterium]